MMRKGMTSKKVDVRRLNMHSNEDCASELQAGLVIETGVQRQQSSPQERDRKYHLEFQLDQLCFPTSEKKNDTLGDCCLYYTRGIEASQLIRCLYARKQGCCGQGKAVLRPRIPILDIADRFEKTEDQGTTTFRPTELPDSFDMSVFGFFMRVPGTSCWNYTAVSAQRLKIEQEIELIFANTRAYIVRNFVTDTRRDEKITRKNRTSRTITCITAVSPLMLRLSNHDRVSKQSSAFRLPLATLRTDTPGARLLIGMHRPQAQAHALPRNRVFCASFNGSHSFHSQD